MGIFLKVFFSISEKIEVNAVLMFEQNIKEVYNLTNISHKPIGLNFPFSFWFLMKTVLIEKNSCLMLRQLKKWLFSLLSMLQRF